MKVVLDTGAFIAIDRGDRQVGAMLRVLQQARVPLSTSAAVVAQVWRDGRTQARLSRVLEGVAIRALGPGDDRRTGELLQVAGTPDVIDAHVALSVDHEDRLLTSDPDDLERLLAARNISAEIVRV